MWEGNEASAISFPQFGTYMNSEQKGGENTQFDMTLEEHFREGMRYPVGSYPEGELLADACKCIAVFATGDARIGSLARSVAIYHAGRFVSSLHAGKIKNRIVKILIRCCQLQLTETIALTAEEKQFIKAAVEMKVYKKFYEV